MKRHIFLIDDDKDEVRIFAEALKQVDGSFKCTYASSAKQALEMLQFLKPDFIIADFNMPILNGLQLLCEIKKNPELRSIPFYLYSTTISTEVSNKAEDFGASGWLRKPDTIEGVAKALEKAIHSEEKFYDLSRGK